MSAELGDQMTLNYVQRDAIESLLRQSLGEKGEPKTFEVDHDLTTKEGKQLRLLGISEGAAKRLARWRSTRVAVFEEVNGNATGTRIPCKLGRSGKKVQGAVVLSGPSGEKALSNERHLHLLDRDPEKGLLFTSKLEGEVYWRTIC